MTIMPLLAVAVAGKTEDAYANEEELSRSKEEDRDKLEMKRNDKGIEIYEISWIKRCNQLGQRKGMGEGWKLPPLETVRKVRRAENSIERHQVLDVMIGIDLSRRR